ncbi:mechanosensitive ion channel [Aureibaculum sp. 2210JD6-5]|uniref:mechanosensitive ion channel domain-containing protein n=1 Tax=Aureibaculum sp. 2210JD6-5 TaxID=3103957 RepID=UPI002AAED5E1|nr:mechanosensitive ion channel domain-containing protein [Aureibaculum sp. 2210JD6-5]MDY7396557.1 mechanosensitive ion channel [Aureibaculum sp. 2210JD6-5]
MIIAYKYQILLTIVLIVVLLIIGQLVKLTIKKFTTLKSIDLNRRKIILNLHYLILYIVFVVFIAIIWGVEPREFTVFISSILAVLGVGFFAQWSILSNLTASVILFFSHPVRIGHRIRIIDKDYDWIGTVMDISGFFLFMKTDKGENITIPNSIVLQHGIEILDDTDDDIG